MKGLKHKDYPSAAEVDEASIEQLVIWDRALPPPQSSNQIEIATAINGRLYRETTRAGRIRIDERLAAAAA